MSEQREAVLYVKREGCWQVVRRVPLRVERVIDFNRYFTAEEMNPGAMVGVAIEPPFPVAVDDFSDAHLTSDGPTWS